MMKLGTAKVECKWTRIGSTGEVVYSKKTILRLLKLSPRRLNTENECLQTGGKKLPSPVSLWVFGVISLSVVSGGTLTPVVSEYQNTVKYQCREQQISSDECQQTSNYRIVFQEVWFWKINRRRNLNLKPYHCPREWQSAAERHVHGGSTLNDENIHISEVFILQNKCHNIVVTVSFHDYV